METPVQHKTESGQMVRHCYMTLVSVTVLIEIEEWIFYQDSIYLDMIINILYRNTIFWEKVKTEQNLDPNKYYRKLWTQYCE